MNAVDAANKAEIAMIHAALNKKFGQLYADIWKVGVNLSLRISDLLTLKYTDLNLEERSLKLTEAKTGKLKTIRLNAAAIAAAFSRIVFNFPVLASVSFNERSSRFKSVYLSVSRSLMRSDKLTPTFQMSA